MNNPLADKIKLMLREFINEADRIIPYDEKPELKAARGYQVSNKDVISDDELNRALALMSAAKQADMAFKKAWNEGNDSFVINWMGQRMVGRVPAELRAHKEFFHYFDLPDLGDGGFQYKLYRNGNLVGTHVKPRADMDVNPNMSNATDAGYNKTFDDRIKYFSIKAGFQGQSQEGIYSVFATPAIDGAIKVRISNYDEMIDFLTKDKGKAQYTADKKGNDISNQMEFKKKLEKIRKDAELIIKRPISSNQIWMQWKDKFIQQNDSPEKQKALDVTQATQDFINYYHQNKGELNKATVSLPPDELAAFQKRQDDIRARLAAARNRNKR